MATIDEIMVVFSMLSANYNYALRCMSQKQISDLQVLWCELLADIDAPILKAAALSHVSESKWFPSIAELRDAAARIVMPDRRTPVEAWGEVKRQIKLAGYYRQPKFSDEVTAAVVADMGWQSICLSEDETATRARFIQGYTDRLKQERGHAIELPQVAEARRQIQNTARRMLIEGHKR